MARVKLSPLLSDISGSVGNVTFQHSQGGLMMRNKPHSVPRGSGTQCFLQRCMATTVMAWHNLTDAQRSDWDNWVKFAPKRTLQQKTRSISSYQLFVKWNVLRLYSGFSLSSSVSWNYDLDYSITPEIQEASGNIYFDANESIIPTERWIILKLSAPVTKSITNPRNSLRIIQIPQGTYTITYISTYYYNALKTLCVAGDKIFMSIIIIAMPSPLIYVYPAVKITVASYP